MGALINISFRECLYTTAKCKNCNKKLAKGTEILSVSRAQGSFTSTSNFCTECAKTEIKSNFDEIMPLMEKIIKVQETLDNLK